MIIVLMSLSESTGKSVELWPRPNNVVFSYEILLSC